MSLTLQKNKAYSNINILQNIDYVEINFNQANLFTEMRLKVELYYKQVKQLLNNSTVGNCGKAFKTRTSLNIAAVILLNGFQSYSLKRKQEENL